MNSRQRVEHLIDAGRYDEAAAEAENLPETDATTWFVRGRIYSRQGNRSKAYSCFNRAIDIDPDFEEARVMAELHGSIFSFKDPNLYNH